MLIRDRHEKILELINQNVRMSLNELITAVDISESTLRRDLNELNSRGLIKLVRGGAESVTAVLGRGEDLIDHRYALFSDEKEMIGKYAASLIKPLDLVFIDSGSTTERMCEFITERKASYVTIGLKHAMILTRAGLNVTIAPGRIKQLTEGLQGSYTMEFLNKFNFSLSFFGALGITLRGGMSTTDGEDAAIKSLVLNRSTKCYLLSDHSKFGIDTAVSFAPLNRMTIITSKGDHLQSYHPHGTIVEL